MKLKKLIILLATLCIVIFLSIAWFWYNSGEYFFESVFGVSMPNGARLVERNEDWSDLGNSGYKYFIYNIEMSRESVCKEISSDISYESSGYSHPVLDEYIDRQESCVKAITNVNGDLFLIGASDKYLVGLILIN
ncbi:hypothetical protein [Microbulbifer spongiae]|uniref:Uncharacterized protein n=1 Tax=Microbulbifer spongiae TaxID=2944933 RepID=A0ABY9EF24_9GAMM|nr:hypothetical protein [Microbulbifer sp. MI-G]WKD50596.1 hypothetical protein M8T91_03990 [Microbulbifer sp. MI-G]